MNMKEFVIEICFGNEREQPKAGGDVMQVLKKYLACQELHHRISSVRFF